MNADIEALRASMRAAQPSQRGNYIETGRHLLELINAKFQRSTISGVTKDSWILEFRTIESSNPKCEAGATQSYIESTKNAGWDGRLKSALAAVVGVDPSAKLTSEVEDMIADIVASLRSDDFRKTKGWPEGFLNGRRVFCEGTPGKSRSGGEVTNKKWMPAPAATP